jgi:hypothetical protein
VVAGAGELIGFELGWKLIEDHGVYCLASRLKSITSSSDKSSAWHSARNVPNVGRRRPAKRSQIVPSSTCACCARSRRVHPRRIRARSTALTFTDHPSSAALSVNVDWPQWKARCYAFRAFRPGVDEGMSHRCRTAGGVVFGGPLLGDADRQQ